MLQSDKLQVETNKDRQLQRRVQSLQRFLMTRLKAELAQRASPLAPDQTKPSAKAAGKAAAGNFNTVSVHLHMDLTKPAALLRINLLS